MNFEIKKEKLSVPHCACKTKAEQNIDCSITLPDYCAEIKRILKCTLIPGVHSVSRTGDRVSAGGAIVIRVLYEGEKEKIDCYEKSLDLSVSAQMKDITDSMIITGKASTGYVNCRATGQRKISVSGNVNVEFSALCEKSKEIPSQIDCDILQCKKERIKAEHLLCLGEKTFDMDETATVDKSLPSIGKVLRQGAYVAIESKKAVSGKLLIKGELVCHIVYCPVESENKLQCFTHTMPLSQIIDVEGIDDDMDLFVKCSVSQLVISVKNDGDEGGRFVEFAARISAVVMGSKVKEYEFIKDCYSTQGEIETEYALIDILCPLNSVKKAETVKETLDIGPSAKEICDIWISDIKTAMKGDGGRAKGNCIVSLCVLYLDEKGCPSYTEKELEFLSEVPLKESTESLKCEFDAAVKKVDFSSLQSGKTEVTLELLPEIRIWEVKSLRLVMNIEKSDSNSQNSVNPALTLYYCNKGEKLWNIAKKYRTTVSAVKEENGIDGEEMQEERMLLIPCV